MGFVRFVAVFVICFGVTSAFSKKVKYVSIGTGGVTGVYYPVGGSIAKMVNSKKDKYKLRVSAESTGGSVYNINAVKTGDLDFGIAQSDKLFSCISRSARMGQKAFERS